MKTHDPFSSLIRTHRPAAEFLKGARDTIPLLIGALPFGMIYGTLAVTAGLSRAAAMGMSAIVFAGSAQFIAVGLIGAGTPVMIIIVTTFVVNLRHLLYSTTLLPHLKKLPLIWRMPLAFWLTDETFAVSVHRWTAEDSSPNKHWYQLGSSLAMYLNWQFWSFMGLVVGASLPDAAGWGLDVAMPVTFIGMTIPFVKSVPMLACVLTAAFSALLFNGLPYKAGLMIACAAGILAGLISERMRIENGRRRSL
ncbi:AzlC family ABC transporter permease [Marispirochaeta sp.]|jgi:4-azaleucine resistance transporter AzlC|uniref:AzlC family ABC transporter permease n=1 Tax=Marispirochaeta sp. TaxID=2038653 RepID=UPI0029C98051|nr:AzlC family ABC transporter permease [Marispirochaeta sp.]